MIIKFKTIDDELNEINFKSECKLENNTYIFKDKSVENTTIYLKIYEDYINIIRKGDTNMYLDLKLNEKLDGNYENKLGLKFNFHSFTREINIKSNGFYATYDLIIDDNIINTHKIWILFN